MTKPTAPTGSGGSPAPSVPPTRFSGRAMSNTMLSVQGTGDDGENYYYIAKKLFKYLPKSSLTLSNLAKFKGRGANKR